MFCRTAQFPLYSLIRLNFIIMASDSNPIGQQQNYQSGQIMAPNRTEITPKAQNIAKVILYVNVYMCGDSYIWSPV